MPATQSVGQEHVTALAEPSEAAAIRPRHASSTGATGRAKMAEAAGTTELMPAVRANTFGGKKIRLGLAGNECGIVECVAGFPC